jgi:hypothetical protein
MYIIIYKLRLLPVTLPNLNRVRGRRTHKIHLPITRQNERNGSSFVLYDTNSTSGTFVNGYRIHEAHLLKNRDLSGLSAATAVLRFEDAD